MIFICSLIIVLQFVPCRTTASREDNIQLRNLTGTLNSIIPIPVSIIPTVGMFVLSESSKVHIDPMNFGTSFIGQYLLDNIKLSADYNTMILEAKETPPNGNVYLTMVGGDSLLREEGYELIFTENFVTLTAF